MIIRFCDSDLSPLFVCLQRKNQLAAAKPFSEDGSIKKELIMQNEPNLRKSQMFITSMKTRDYNEKMKLDTWSKRTQSNPILGVGCRVGKAVGELLVWFCGLLWWGWGCAA